MDTEGVGNKRELVGNRGGCKRRRRVVGYREELEADGKRWELE